MENKEVVLILEDMRSDFRAFKESLSGIRESIDKTNKRLDDAVNFLQNMMFEHEKWLQDHEIRIKTIEVKVA